MYSEMTSLGWGHSDNVQSTRPTSIVKKVSVHKFRFPSYEFLGSGFSE